jgi:hypothetical protein
LLVGNPALPARAMFDALMRIEELPGVAALRGSRN